MRVQGYRISKKISDQCRVMKYGQPTQRMLNKGKTSSLDADEERKKDNVGSRKTPTNATMMAFRILHDTGTPGRQDRKEGPRSQNSIRCHASGMEALRVQFRDNGDICSHHHVVTRSANCRRAVFHLLLVLSEGEGLCSHELAALLLHPTQATFAGGLMLFRGHCNVVRWEAASSVIGKERAVSSIENIHFWVRKYGVLMSIRCTVLVADELGPIVI